LQRFVVQLFDAPRDAAAFDQLEKRRCGFFCRQTVSSAKQFTIMSATTGAAAR
jgi:hypothetical protein